MVADSIVPLIEQQPDAIVLATGSFLPDVHDDVLACARAGVSLVSPCEELAYPYTRDPAVAEEIDAAAREGGATILGSGVNPGFIFDTLVATATGVAWDITQIRGRRVVDTFEFGQNIHLRLGIGYTQEEFDRGHEDGSIAGHVGFPESIQIVCERIGVTLDHPVEERFEPLIADTAAPTKYGEVEAGRTEGFVQIAPPASSAARSSSAMSCCSTCARARPATSPPTRSRSTGSTRSTSRSAQAWTPCSRPRRSW